MPVSLGLQGEEDYPHEGTINFVNNQFNPATGSISVRGKFDNPRPAGGGARLISPGMYARIRLQVGDPHQSLLVIDRAIVADQGLKYLYVVDSDNKVQQRRITTGSLQKDGLRVIETGLKPTERVVVGALQQVRPKQTVKVEEMTMPSLNEPDAAQDAGGKKKPAAKKTQPRAAAAEQTKPAEQPAAAKAEK
jgi:multidrug efflux system membrane fusion protein